MVDTPPDAPVTSTRSPGRTCPRTTTACQAVTPTRLAAAAASKGQPGRDLDQVGGGDHGVVGEATRGVLADDPEFARKAGWGRGAVAVVPVVVERRIHHHPRTDRNVRGAGTHRVHHSRDVRPPDVRQRDVDGQPAPHPQVEVVHRGRPHGDPYLAGAGHRIGHLARCARPRDRRIRGREPPLMRLIPRRWGDGLRRANTLRTLLHARASMAV